nr:KUP/HAK/KT family potassium transporter [Legionella tunisiensis]
MKAAFWLYWLYSSKKTTHESLFYLLAIFGAGLLLGDGMLTPAISVTSAIEGLKVIAPQFDDFIIPLSCTILILLLLCSRKVLEKLVLPLDP